MRVLVGPDHDDRATSLAELYAVPQGAESWLRVNMVSTVDGAATGESGDSKTINNEADKEVFDLLRAQADVLIVGAGTLRAEAYAVPGKPLAIVSRSASVPPSLAEAPQGRLLMATVSSSPGLAEARDRLGAENVLVLGSHRIDLADLRTELVGRGFRNLLSEGGPHLLRDLLDQECVDELDTTFVPQVIGGTHPRITDGPPIDVPVRLHTLVEVDGTLLARWLV